MPIPNSYILAGVGVVAALLSVRFVMLGAWPVLVFALLDIGALAVAFYVFSRRPVPEELISLIGDQVVILRSDGQGKAHRLALPAFWTRLEVTSHSEVQCDLHLVFRQGRHPIGSCVSAAERRSLIPRIEALLARARQP